MFEEAKAGEPKVDALFLTEQSNPFVLRFGREMVRKYIFLDVSVAGISPGD